MHIRQVVLVAADLEEVSGLLKDTLRIGECYREPKSVGLDFENVVMPIGSDFLEVVAPNRKDSPTVRYLATSGGDGGYMVVAQCTDFEAARRRAEAAGVRWIWKLDYQDQRQWQIHPKDVGGAIVAIDWAGSPTKWRWAGPDWDSHVADDLVSRVLGIEVSTTNPDALASRWAEVLGGVLLTDSRGLPVLNLDTSYVRFRSWERALDRLTGVDIEVRDVAQLHANVKGKGIRLQGDSFSAAGINWRIVPKAR